MQVRLKFSLSFCFVCLDIQRANFLLIATTKEGMIFTRQEYYVWEMRLMPRGQFIALLPLGSLCLVSLRVWALLWYFFVNNSIPAEPHTRTRSFGGKYHSRLALAPDWHKRKISWFWLVEAYNTHFIPSLLWKSFLLNDFHSCLPLAPSMLERKYLGSDWSRHSNTHFILFLVEKYLLVNFRSVNLC